MGACVDCGTSSVFLRTSREGLCQDCQEAVRSRFEKEKQRLKEAVIFAGALNDPRDQAIHLRRAMNSVRALRGFEELGCGPVKPDLGAMARSLSARLGALRVEPETDGRGQPLEAAPGRDPPERPGGTGGDRRRAERRPEALPVRLGRGRVRALTTDISAEGVCVHAPVSERPGARLGLTLQLQQGPVTTEGVVRWARPAGPPARGAGPAVMGLEFSARLRPNQIQARAGRRRHAGG